MRQKPTPLAVVGVSIAVAAVALAMVLGFADQRPTFANGTYTSRLDCGSVFAPSGFHSSTPGVECNVHLSERRSLLLAISIPGLLLGLGVMIAGSTRRGDSVQSIRVEEKTPIMGRAQVIEKVIPPEGLPARMSSDASEKPVTRIEGGTTVRIVSRSGSWAFVSVDEPGGYRNYWVDDRRLEEPPLD